MTWTTTLNGSSMHKNRAWVPPRRSFKLLKPKWGVGPGLSKMGPGGTRMGPGWDPDGTRWDPVGPEWDPARKKMGPGDNADGTCVAKMGPGGRGLGTRLAKNRTRGGPG